MHVSFHLSWYFWTNFNLYLSIHSKKHQRTLTVVKGSTQATAPVMKLEVDTPAYLEVPEFQRVAIIGDYASGVLSL